MTPVRVNSCRRLLALRYVLFALAFAASLLALAGCGSVVETSWSPDAKAISYSAGGELRVYDLATKQSRRLDTGAGYVISPAWSPDGKAIAFYSITWGKNAAVVVRAIDLDSAHVRTLASDVWPLPRELTSAQVPTGETSDQALLEAQQKALLVLAFTATIAWSPDSTHLASVAASQSGGRVLLVDYAAGDAKPIIEEKHAIITLAWAPDGKRLAYVRASGPPVEPLPQPQQGPQPQSALEGTGSLRLYDFDAGAQSKLCDLPKDAFVRLEWSADSKEMGFIITDPHNEGRAIGCVVEARPGSPIHEELRGITAAATWAPGLRGVAFLEEREGGQVVLLYRGLVPRTRKVLGALPRATPGEQEVQSESCDGGDSYSLPTFSRDGRKLALRVGEDERLQIAVFDLP